MSLSKLFVERITRKNLLCSDIVHPGESCLEFNSFIIRYTWIHCAKFYAPIVLLPLVKKFKYLSWIQVKESLILYMHMILGSYIPSVFTVGCICTLSKIFGKIYLPTLLYIPNFIATILYIPFMDQRVADIYANIMLMVNIEALIREGRSSFWKTLGNSKLIQTTLFMVSSAIILDTMGTMPTSIFWFINPRTEDRSTKHLFEKSPIMDKIFPTRKHACHHKSSCDQFIWQGTKKTSVTMMGFELLRVVLTNFKTISNNPTKALSILKTKMNFPLITMISGYTFIYKLSQCLQNRLRKQPSEYSNLVSGFLCGSVFWINAELSLLCHGLAAAMQLILQNYFIKWLQSKKQFLANYTTKFPWSKLFYTSIIGYALHMIVLYPSLCSNFMHKISDAVLSYRFRSIRKNTFNALFSATISST